MKVVSKGREYIYKRVSVLLKEEDFDYITFLNWKHGNAMLTQTIVDIIKEHKDKNKEYKQLKKQ